MPLGYKYYRQNLIKVLLLTVACIPIFWEYFQGKAHKDTEPAALILIAALAVVGNFGLFILMLRAKRREHHHHLATLRPADSSRRR